MQRRGFLSLLGFLGMSSTVPATAAMAPPVDEYTEQEHPYLGKITHVSVHGEWDFHQLVYHNDAHVLYPAEHRITLHGTEGEAEFVGFNLKQEEIAEVKRCLPAFIKQVKKVLTTKLEPGGYVQVGGVKFYISSYTCLV